MGEPQAIAAREPASRRRLWRFHGGIRPPENKSQSLRRPIRPAGVPPRLLIALSQYSGAPAEPAVAAGQRVLKGEPLTRASGLLSVPQHAPTSGTVLAIEERPVVHPSGLPAPCIVLAPDGEERWVERRGVADFRRLRKSELVALIRAAGIAGLGGAGFPAAVKLNVDSATPIETLIVNGSECEPCITADDALMRERPGEVVAGADILRHIVGPRETLIAVEDNKPRAIAALRAAAAGSGIEIVPLPTRYPSGGERQLIEILTGRQVPSGGLPPDIGALCQNVGSAAAIHRAVAHGEPLISRITTLAGGALAEPGNFEVLLGTPIEWLLELASYRARANSRLIVGGPLMGFAIDDPAAAVVKTTNCVLAATEAELPEPPAAQACIRCGLCAEVCPASLLPQQMYWFAQGGEFEKLEDHRLFDCIECGACSYVCPSHIPLVQYYRASKAEIGRMRTEHARAEHSRARFEARQERVEREARALRERRRAREAARQRAREAGADPLIEAAVARAKARREGSAAD